MPLQALRRTWGSSRNFHPSALTFPKSHLKSRRRQPGSVTGLGGLKTETVITQIAERWKTKESKLWSCSFAGKYALVSVSIRAYKRSTAWLCAAALGCKDNWLIWRGNKILTKCCRANFVSLTAAAMVSTSPQPREHVFLCNINIIWKPKKNFGDVKLCARRGGGRETSKDREGEAETHSRQMEEPESPRAAL